MWSFKIFYLIIQKVWMLCSICAKIKKKRVQNKDSVSNLKSSGSSHQKSAAYQSACRVLWQVTEKNISPSDEDEASASCFEPAPLSWLWHTASCCIWCTPHRKRLRAHKLFFQLSAPYVSDTRVGNEAESYLARHEQTVGVQRELAQPGAAPEQRESGADR